VESARLDEYWFRHRARTVRLLAEALAGRAAAPLDPAAWARRVAEEEDAALHADLRARLAEPVADAEWDRLVAAAGAEARRQLVAEYGNPDPHRLA
jgi:hypothetical protein